MFALTAWGNVLGGERNVLVGEISGEYVREAMSRGMLYTRSKNRDPVGSCSAVRICSLSVILLGTKLSTN